VVVHHLQFLEIGIHSDSETASAMADVGMVESSTLTTLASAMVTGFDSLVTAATGSDLLDCFSEDAEALA
jgi:hypothetical protein